MTISAPVIRKVMTRDSTQRPRLRAPARAVAPSLPSLRPRPSQYRAAHARSTLPQNKWSLFGDKGFHLLRIQTLPRNHISPEPSELPLGILARLAIGRRDGDIERHCIQVTSQWR